MASASRADIFFTHERDVIAARNGQRTRADSFHTAWAESGPSGPPEPLTTNVIAAHAFPAINDGLANHRNVTQRRES